MDAIKNLRVGARLGLAFVVLLTLMLAMAGVGALLTQSINRYAEFYPANILPSLRLIHRIDGAAANARRLEQQHLLMEDGQQKKAVGVELAQTREDLRKALKDYEPLVADDEDRGHLKRVTEAVDAMMAVQDKVLKASDDGAADPTQTTAARELNTGVSRERFVALLGVCAAEPGSS